MRLTGSSWPQILSVKVYTQLLLLYPKSYRQKYAVHMERTFGDCCTFAFRESGVRGLFALWLPTLADLSLTIIKKHLDEGVLSTQATLIRAISSMLLGAAALMFAASWGSGLEFMLVATVLLIFGASGLVITSPIAAETINHMSDGVTSEGDNQGRWTMDNNVGRSFMLRWISASGLGLVVGFAVYFALAVNVGAELNVVLRTIISVIGGALLGASIGIAQWQVLRGQVSPPDQWVIPNTVSGAVGGAIALALAEGISDATSFTVALTVGAVVVGISLGIAGWFVLRRHVAQAGWWIVASVVGITVALALSNGLGQGLYAVTEGPLGEDLATILAMIIFGGLLLTGYGAITGAVLVRLLRQPQIVASERLRVAD